MISKVSFDEISTSSNHKDIKAKLIFNKQLKRNCKSIMNDVVQIGKVNCSISNCITSLQKEPSKRTSNDLTYIKTFLEKTELGRKLSVDHASNQSVQQILIMCGTEMKYLFYQSNKTLFHIGDEGTHFYIIIKGKIEILKPKMIKTTLTGFQYFECIIKLYDNRETYLINKILEANYTLFPIDYSIMPFLKVIVLSMIVDGYLLMKNIKRSKLLEVIASCHIDLGKISDIDVEDKDDDYIDDIDSFIKDYLKQIAHIKIDNYITLKNKQFAQSVTIYECQACIQLESGAYFGDCALDKKTVRNATIRTIEDTHFCYLDIQNYNNYLLAEKNRLGALEISFLVTNFFFRNISNTFFEKKYFGSFIDEDYFKNEYLCYEDRNVDYVYFIRNGQIELTTHKNVFEIHALINCLLKIIDKDNEDNDQMRNCHNDFSQLVDYFSQKTHNKLFIINEREVIGAECFFYGINYIFSAKVISKRAKIYKIGLKELLKILQTEIRSYDNLQLFSQKKINVVIDRLKEIKNTHICLIDYKARSSGLLTQKQINDASKVNDCGNENVSYNTNDLPNFVFKSFKPSICLTNNLRNSSKSSSPCFITEYDANIINSKKINRQLITRKKNSNNSLMYPSINKSLEDSNGNKHHSIYISPKGKGKKNQFSRSTFDNSPVSLFNETKLISKIQKELKQDHNKLYSNSFAIHLSHTKSNWDSHIPDIKKQIKLKPVYKRKNKIQICETEPELPKKNYRNNNKEIVEDEYPLIKEYSSCFSLTKRFSGNYFRQRLFQYKQFRTKHTSPL